MQVAAGPPLASATVQSRGRLGSAATRWSPSGVGFQRSSSPVPPLKLNGDSAPAQSSNARRPKQASSQQNGSTSGSQKPQMARTLGHMRVQPPSTVPEETATMSPRSARGYTAASGSETERGSSSDLLDVMMLPGDVLVAFETGRLWDIGRAGGFMGHTLLVTSRPRRILRNSIAAFEYDAVWPKTGASEIWALETVESTRGSQGLHEATVLLYVDNDGRLTLIGEESPVHGLCYQDHEVLELWQSPPELRMRLRLDLMQDALLEMRAQIGGSNWSVTTAARAMLTSANIAAGAREAEVAACWKQEPICTSVVISIWQRYLCKAAEVINATTPDAPVQSIDLIRKFMPLKADRGLPGELLAAMQEAGWVRVANIKKGPPNSTRAALPATVLPAAVVGGSSTPSCPQPQAPMRFTPTVRRAQCAQLHQTVTQVQHVQSVKQPQQATQAHQTVTQLHQPQQAQQAQSVKIAMRQDKARISIISDGGSVRDAAKMFEHSGHSYGQVHTLRALQTTATWKLRTMSM